MTVTARPGHGGWMLWIGHYGALAVVGALCVNIAANFFTGITVQSLDAACWVLILTLLWLSFRHNARLCERCIAEVPLDGSEKAARPAVFRMLRIRHTSMRVLIVFAVIILGVSFVRATLPWANGALTAAADLPVLIFWLAIYVHRRFEPWCPWCRHDGGGELEAEVPGPPGDRKPVPAGSA